MTNEYRTHCHVCGVVITKDNAEKHWTLLINDNGIQGYGLDQGVYKRDQAYALGNGDLDWLWFSYENEHSYRERNATKAEFLDFNLRAACAYYRNTRTKPIIYISH